MPKLKKISRLWLNKEISRQPFPQSLCELVQICLQKLPVGEEMHFQKVTELLQLPIWRQQHGCYHGNCHHCSSTCQFGCQQLSLDLMLYTSGLAPSIKSHWLKSILTYFFTKLKRRVQVQPSLFISSVLFEQHTGVDKTPLYYLFSYLGIYCKLSLAALMTSRLLLELRYLPHLKVTLDQIEKM